tara:strand:- start:120057 stop:120785 length:729 start_codon:yes stop_codon:yes gene_type:complete
MESNNTDRQIKNQLEKRELNPSLKSWEELRSRLDANEKKKSPIYWYLGLAASFVAGILIVSLLFNTNISNDNPVVVEEQLVEPTENKNELPVFDTLQGDSAIANSKSQRVVEETTPKEPVIKPETNLNKNQQTASAVAEMIDKDKGVLLNKKVEEVIAQVSSHEAEQDSLTVSEIDALLAKATAEIVKERQKDLYQDQGYISATNLLNEVENELEQSFRDKIFEMLKDGFNKTRTAVANRNQ